MSTNPPPASILDILDRARVVDPRYAYVSVCRSPCGTVWEFESVDEDPEHPYLRVSVPADEDPEAGVLRVLAAHMRRKAREARGEARMALVGADKARAEAVQATETADRFAAQAGEAERVAELRARSSGARSRSASDGVVSEGELGVLGGLLARVHRDGGHRAAEVGLEAAAEADLILAEHLVR